MPLLVLKSLEAYRARTFRAAPARRVASFSQAVDFVNARGFVHFWPVKSILLPSLWVAAAGDRPVPNAHDDPGHITWRWKDDALGKKVWYYAKILRRKASFISLAIAPYFYALSENYGTLEEDYLILYEEGRLTQAAKQVYEALLDKGALNTLDLRRASRLVNARDSEFNRALEDLQTDFKIMPVGVAEAGSWRYAFIYDITARHMPELPEEARAISEAQARQQLVELYFRSLGAAQRRDVTKLFMWPPELVGRAVDKLIKQGVLIGGISHPQQSGEWLALPELVEGEK